jgi:hypothetical protein
MKSPIFWETTPYSLPKTNWRFGRIRYLYLQGRRRRRYVLPKRQFSLNELYVVTSQKTNASCIAELATWVVARSVSYSISELVTGSLLIMKCVYSLVDQWILSRIQAGSGSSSSSSEGVNRKFLWLRDGYSSKTQRKGNASRWKPLTKEWWRHASEL